MIVSEGKKERSVSIHTGDTWPSVSEFCSLDDW